MLNKYRCKTSIHSFACFALAILLIFAAFAPILANAAVINTATPANCDVLYLVNDRPVPGVQINLYHVADVNTATGKFFWNSRFEPYKLTLNTSDNETMTALAETLVSYVTRDNIAPTMTKKTDDEGRISFAGFELGMYLVYGPTYTNNNYSYSIVPMLVMFPYLDENGVFSYSADIELKHKESYVPPYYPSESTINRKVIKVWEDNKTANRPEMVTIELLRDGQTWDSVELSDENNWRYTWTALPQNHVWTVVEVNVPDGYTSSVRKEDGTFVVTNTEEDEPEGSTPPTPSNSDPDESNSVDTQNSPSSVTPEPNTTTKLPQTGQLWWPVPVLAGVGMAMVCGGLWLKKREEGRT